MKIDLSNKEISIIINTLESADQVPGSSEEELNIIADYLRKQVPELETLTENCAVKAISAMKAYEILNTCHADEYDSYHVKWVAADKEWQKAHDKLEEWYKER